MIIQNNDNIQIYKQEQMFLRRDFLTKKQLLQNKKSDRKSGISGQTLQKLKQKALQQLSMNRIKNREVEFHRIQIFLLVAPIQEIIKFYQQLKNGIQDIFNDQKAKKIVDDKWSHSLKSNIMGLFNKIAHDFYLLEPVHDIFGKLYADTIGRLMREDRLSRIQEKFLDCFVIQTIRLNQNLDILGKQQVNDIRALTQKVRMTMSQHQVPKSLSPSHFLQYAIMSLLKMQLPHDKYLYSHLIHAPNPKYLLPFKRKGAFISLTNEILVKLSKVDMIGFRYWSYFDYQQSDVYPKIRKATGWEAKSQIMRMILKDKIKSGLERYMNLINEKIKSYSNRQIDQSGINDIMSYLEICLQICNKKKDHDDKIFETALQRVDLGQVFQQKNFENEPRIKQCMLKLVELYLKLLVFCSKKNLKGKFIQKISVIMCKLIKGYNQQKFKTDMTNIVLKVSENLDQEQRTDLLHYAMDYANREWQKEQERSNNVIAKINPYIVSFISELAYKFGFDENHAKHKIQKLEFFYILAINYKQNDYFESKKKLSVIPVDINDSLINNPIFSMLEVRKIYQQGLRQHLRSVYQNYHVEKSQHEALLAIIDQIVSFRIQVAKENAHRQDFQSFFSVLVSFLEQSQRVDTSGKLLKIVRNYFYRCIKTYMQDTSRLKFQDSGKKACISLLIKNVCFLVQGTVSANPVISQFCQKILHQYIQYYPQISLYTQILTVLCECLSFLYRKSSQQYESKSERLRYKSYTSNILIPTKSKQLTSYIIKLMSALYKIILNGYCLNESYLKFRVLYLIKQNAKTANITFGWKYLKHLVTNFKEDREFVAKDVLLNNSCAWFINQEFFVRKVGGMRPERILLDRCLLPLHVGKCDGSDLRKIYTSVQPQMEVQFLIAPPEDKVNQVDLIIQQLQDGCQLIQAEYDKQKSEQALQSQQNKLYQIISRIKMAYINTNTATHVLSRILQVCRKYNNNELLKYVYLKVVPLLYCMTDNVIKSLVISSETLYYIVKELNSVGALYLEKSNKSPTSNEQDTFDIKSQYFDESIRNYEKAEDNPDYYKLQKQLTDSDDRVKRFMIMRLHHRRMFSLQKMHKQILKYISQHFHVFIAKGIPLMEFAQILKINFLIDPNIFQFLSLQSICYCLTIHLQLVNMLKASVQKGQVDYDDAFIDDFYLKTLKIGLFHFQKRKTYYKEQLITKKNNIKSLKTKISFFIQICDYLRNDDFHRFRKKKLPKRDEIFGKPKRDDNLLQKILNYTKQRHLDRADTISMMDEGNQAMNSRQSNLNINDEEVDMAVFRYGLLYLISQQVDKIKAYSYMQLADIENPYSLAGKKKFISHGQVLKLYGYLGKSSSVLIYNIVKIFGKRIDNPDAIYNKIKDTITTEPDYGFPEFLSLYIERNINSKSILKRINFWKPPNVQILFKYLSQEYEQYPYLQLYVTKVLSRLHSEQILFYLPQIHQTLTLRTGQIVYDFLLQYAKKSASFAHQLIWIAKVQSKQERDPHNKNPRLPGVDQNLQKLGRMSNRLVSDAIRQFSREQKSFFKEVDSFYEEVTGVSGQLDPKWPFAQKKQKILQQVQKIQVPKSIYLPTNPFFQVKRIQLTSGTPMQSAAKCPFLLTFVCQKYDGPDRDFERRRQLKKKRRFIDSDEQIQPIQQQQLPSRMPIIRSAVMGSKVGKMNLSKSVVNSESEITTPKNMGQSNSFYHSNGNNDQIDQNDIRMTIDENMYQSMRNNKSKRSVAQRQQKQKMGGSTNEVQVSCIFKVFDDIRQDCLALQVIQLFLQIFQKNNLDLKLFPYKTISNRTGATANIGGIIEVVPKTVSRDSIGKTNEQSLYQYFLSNFGPQYNSVFQEARQNFIKSQAAYSIVSYILQIKDRHNGNILINKEEGYLVHIDFGFIFDISPANNLRFERADFKLTDQMIKIMGGKIDSQPFQLYMNLVIKGFLVVRKYQEHIQNIVKLMYHSGLPCFLARSLENLESRFVMHLSQIQAAQYMKDIILKAADHWTTNWYDKIQWMQQRIYH